MTALQSAVPSDDRPVEPIALVDLLDRVLGVGVVLAGDVTISIAEIDLVQIHLAAVISSVRPDLIPSRR